jgi:DnaJ-class molecular chaperone
MSEKLVQCPFCEGNGVFREEVLMGYVSYDMAMDAEDTELEGEPVIETIEYKCRCCEGAGKLKEEDLAKYQDSLLPF